MCNERLFVQRICATSGNLCNARLKSGNCSFCLCNDFFVQRVDVAETDKDLEDTGLSRPKASVEVQPQEDPPAPDPDEQDTEQLMESVQSVRPKAVEAVGGSLTEDLHSKKQFLYLQMVIPNHRPVIALKIKNISFLFKFKL